MCAGTTYDATFAIDNNKFNGIAAAPCDTICADSLSTSRKASAAVACSLTHVPSRALSGPHGWMMRNRGRDTLGF
jgi:hypothetical protein